MDMQPRVFISYARADGETFAADLSKRLATELGKDVPWRDRDRMEGGVSWWKQITEALEAVSFMVLVATPAAMASPVVRKEWRYARQQGVCVYPVQVPGLPIDFAALPRWMRDSHFYNLDKEWETFVNYLKHPCRAEKVPFMAPDLPAHFVERPREFGELVSRLLDADRQNPVAITTALKGAGGFGKTTLAIALCHDEDVQAAFDDGILWVTLGEQPDVLGGLTKLYAALTGERTAFIDVEDAAKELADKLADKDCLIVIDDVWNGAHLHPFLRGGERCARLITTRDVGIAVGAKAIMTDVDEMTAGESIQLLSSGIPGLERGRLERMVKRLGEWALMLELANAMLRERMATAGDSPNSAFTWLEKVLDRRGVTGVHRDNEEKRKQDAAGVLASSLELLTADQRERLCQMAVFKDDADVPLSSVGALWAMDEFDTEELVLLLARRTLLKFSSSTGTIRLHDVVREFLATQVVDMSALHRKLVEAWGDVYALPDIYAWNWIGYHFVEAGQSRRLRDFLFDFRWLEAKLNALNASALLADCDRLPGDAAIRLVRQALSLSAPALALDKRTLAGQLLERTRKVADEPELARLRAVIIDPYDLRLINKQPVLAGAGGNELARFTGHTGSVFGVLALNDGSILSWSSDNTLRRWSRDGREIARFEGHTETVNGALALDDDSILSWSEDQTLRRWSRDGREISRFEGHTKMVNGALALDDDSILSWSADSTLRRWSRDGHELVRFDGHMNAVRGALALDDGSLLSWSNDETLRRWSRNGTELVCFIGHRDLVSGALVLDDGSLLSWSWDETLRRWSPDGDELARFVGHRDLVNGALALDDGSLLSWSSDDTLRRWSPDGTELARFVGHLVAVSGALELNDGSILSWSDDKTLRQWSCDGRELARFEGHADTVWGALALDDGSILSWSADHTLRCWSRDGRELARFEGHADTVWGALALDDGSILSWSFDGVLRRWSLDEHIALMGETAGHAARVRDMLDLGDDSILSWSEDKTLRRWSPDGTELACFVGHTEWVNGALALDNGSILSWSNDKTLRRWSCNGTEMTCYIGHANLVSGALALDDGSILSWSRFDIDKTLWRWAHDGRELARFVGHIGSANGALALEDKTILSWSTDGTLRRWLRDGRVLVRFVGHTSDVKGALALDDGTLLSWSDDGTLRRWARDGRELARFDGHTGSVDVALALDNNTILSWSNDMTLRHWSLDGLELARLDVGFYPQNWDRPIVCAWARTQGFDTGALFAAWGDVPVLTEWAARRGNAVYVYDASTGETLARFVGDAEISCLAVSGDVIAAGDAAGRVLFLRWQSPSE